MPMILDLKHGQRLYINGAVIEISGGATQIAFHNHAVVVRDTEIIQGDDLTTLGRNLYFSCQQAYMFPSRERDNAEAALSLVEEIERLMPQIGDLARTVRSQIANGDYYRAMRSARKIIHAENERDGIQGRALRAPTASQCPAEGA